MSSTETTDEEGSAVPQEQHREQGEQEHYFSADPSVPFERIPVDAEAWGQHFRLMSGAGVFSKGEVDHGTAVLFKEVPPPQGPVRVLDLGCGYGVIARAIQEADPEAEVWGVDVNERALVLARENGVNAVTTAAFPADLSFDEIWSNPPIRIGKQALHELLLTWLPRLARGGRAVLVVGKNLGADSLQAWLIAQGWPTSRVGSSKGFRVLVVQKDRQAAE